MKFLFFIVCFATGCGVNLNNLKSKPDSRVADSQKVSASPVDLTIKTSDGVFTLMMRGYIELSNVEDQKAYIKTIDKWTEYLFYLMGKEGTYRRFEVGLSDLKVVDGSVGKKAAEDAIGELIERVESSVNVYSKSKTGLNTIYVGAIRFLNFIDRTNKWEESPNLESQKSSL